MIKQEPFKRAKALFDLIAEAMALPLHLQKAMLEALPQYESRGHGLRSAKMRRTNFARPVHNAPPQKQGKREIERRLRQAAHV